MNEQQEREISTPSGRRAFVLDLRRLVEGKHIMFGSVS